MVFCKVTDLFALLHFHPLLVNIFMLASGYFIVSSPDSC